MVWLRVVLLCTVTSTASPSLTWIRGPGTWALKPHTLALKPGATSRSTSSMVSSNWRVSARAPAAASRVVASSQTGSQTGSKKSLAVMLLSSVAAAQFPQVGNQCVDVVVGEVAAPGGHQHRLVDALAAVLDGLEQLLVGARRHLAPVRVIAGLDRHGGHVDPLAVAVDPVALGAVDVVQGLALLGLRRHRQGQ